MGAEKTVVWASETTGIAPVWLTTRATRAAVRETTRDTMARFGVSEPFLFWSLFGRVVRSTCEDGTNNWGRCAFLPLMMSRPSPIGNFGKLCS